MVHSGHRHLANSLARTCWQNIRHGYTPYAGYRTAVGQIQALVSNLVAGDMLKVQALKGTQVIAEETIAGMSATLRIESPTLWSPETPFLYDLKISILRKGKVIDAVSSYFAMRKISSAPDAAGNLRMLLNNNFCFSMARSTRDGGPMVSILPNRRGPQV
jgi:hypothetical protein